MYRSDFGGRRNFGPREMTKVICSDCGKECEVPFKPTEGRPVYCQECLPKHRRPRFESPHLPIYHFYFHVPVSYLLLSYYSTR